MTFYSVIQIGGQSLSLEDQEADLLSDHIFEDRLHLEKTVLRHVFSKIHTPSLAA